ncbi:MAG: hypothetical protein ACPL5F_09675 [Moorellaceae bacterium]
MKSSYDILDRLAEALLRTLETPNEYDRNLEPANVVDGLYFLGRAIHRLAQAVEALAEAGRTEKEA